jgi:hypothetical protein
MEAAASRLAACAWKVGLDSRERSLTRWERVRKVGQYRPGYLLQKTTFMTNKLEMVARVGRYKGSRTED